MRSGRLLSSVLTALALLASVAPALSAQTRPANRPKPATPPAAAADIKVVTRATMEGGHSFEDTHYIKGARDRREMSVGGGYAMITQCDMKRYVQLNQQAKTYTVHPFGASADAGAQTTNAGARPAVAQRRGGVITYTNHSTDTGERKQLFGFTARRIKTQTTVESSPDACSQTKMKMETDGWYIDLKYGLDCQNMQTAPRTYAGGASACEDQYRYKNTGLAATGLPVDITITTYGPDGTASVMRREVIELSRQPLDAALFDIPPGYTEAKDGQASSGVNNAGGEDEDTAQTSNSAHTSGVAQQAQNSSGALGPKRPGVIRVGVVVPQAQLGQGSTGANVAEPLRDIIAQHLRGPAVEVAALDARVPSQIVLEAKQKECDFVLHTSVTQKQGGGGGFGGFMRKAAPVAASVPYYGAGSTAGAVAAGVASAAIYTAAEISANNVKARDEITIKYELMNADGTTPKASSSVKAKAKSDGEDVLTPLIRQVAAAVHVAVAQ